MLKDIYIYIYQSYHAPEINHDTCDCRYVIGVVSTSLSHINFQNSFYSIKGETNRQQNVTKIIHYQCLHHPVVIVDDKTHKLARSAFNELENVTDMLLLILLFIIHVQIIIIYINDFYYLT